MRHPWNRTLPIAQNKRVTNGASAIQAATCGHRLGIFGPFQENLATERPNMRQPLRVLLASAGSVAASIADQIFPDHDPRAMDTGLDAFAGKAEHAGDFVDRQFLDIAQQDHFAIMIGQ